MILFFSISRTVLIPNHKQGTSSPLKGSGSISGAAIFASKPDIHKIFPSPISFSFRGTSDAVASSSSSASTLAVSSAQSRAAILSVATTKRGEAGRNVFATCGADGTLRLHNMLEENPLVELPLSEGYLLDVKWSYTRSAVFASAGEDGMIYFFDLAKNQVGVLSMS